jgi:hypothetical protein
MATLVELYEEQARGCIELAEKKHDEPTIRDALLKMARDWLRDAAALRRAEGGGSVQSTSSDELRSDHTRAA